MHKAASTTETTDKSRTYLNPFVLRNLLAFTANRPATEPIRTILVIRSAFANLTVRKTLKNLNVLNIRKVELNGMIAIRSIKLPVKNFFLLWAMVNLTK